MNRDTFENGLENYAIKLIVFSWAKKVRDFQLRSIFSTIEKIYVSWNSVEIFTENS